MGAKSIQFDFVATQTSREFDRSHQRKKLRNHKTSRIFCIFLLFVDEDVELNDEIKRSFEHPNFAGAIFP